ncbi:MAG: hypothetical protein WAK91_17650 [Candidatus Acidiferrales bacterium]|jgi:hypothetical protein
MKKRAILLTMAAMFAVVAVCFAAADSNMGTWKLNEAKSKFPAGATKNHTVVYSAAGDSVKVTVDGVTADGKAVHDEWTGKFDGKDYPVTGEPSYDSRSYTRVDANTLKMTLKKDGKVVGTGRIAVSADGKSRTVTVSITDAMGKKTSSTAVYDKQ